MKGRAAAMAQPDTALSAERNTVQELEEEVRILERRLREGEELVRRTKQKGGDRELLERWEAAWVKLLHQYERLCDRLERQSGTKRTDQTSRF